MDSRLEHSSYTIISWPLCDVRLKNHADYPWIILIPRVENTITEIDELTAAENVILMQEITRTAKVLKKYFNADKINIGALGNIVSQLHIHVIARHKTDPLWPHSVWQAALSENPYTSENKDKIIADLRALLS